MKIKMAQYGLGHQQQQTYNQTPYTEQQFQQPQPTTLYDPPQYRGQSGGLQPQGTDGRGPAQETRYGATPVSTTAYNNNYHNNQGAPFDGGNHLNQRYETSPIDAIRDPAAYGFQKQTQPQPETGFRFPGVTTYPQSHQNQMHSGVGAPAQSGFKSSDQVGGGYGQERDRMQGGYGNSGYGGTHGGQGFGYSQMGLGQGNYGSHQGDQSVMHSRTEDDFARPQPGYGQPGFGAPTQGANTTNLWPSLVTPAEAHKSDLIGQGALQNSNQQQQQQSGGDRFQGHQHAGLLYGHGGDRDRQQGYGGGENLASKEQYGTDGAPWQAGGVDPNERFGPEKIEGDQMHGHQHAGLLYGQGRGRDHQQGYGLGENLAKTEQYGTDGTPWQAGGVNPKDTFEGDQKHGHQSTGLLYGQGGGRDPHQGYGGGENLGKTEQYGTDGAPSQGGVNHMENFSSEKTEGDQKHAGPYGSTAVDATHGPYTGAKDSMTSSAVGGDTDGYGDRVHTATRQKQSGYDVSEPLGDGYAKGNVTGAGAYLPGSNAESAMGFGTAKDSAATDSGLPQSSKTTETRTEPGYDGSSKLRLCVCIFGCNIVNCARALHATENARFPMHAHVRAAGRSERKFSHTSVPLIHPT